MIHYIHKCCRASIIILTSIISLTLFSCSPQVNVFVRKSYPAREENEPIVIYQKQQDVPIKSEKIGTLEAICTNWMEDCDSASIFSIAETKINKAGGNALLITKFKQQLSENNSKLRLTGDVLFVSDFSSPPDTALSFFEKYMYLGLGAGPETGISLFIPKISYYNFQDRKILSTYYGIEASLWVIERPMMSLDCLYGVKKSIFTLDTSVGVWWLPKTKFGKDENNFDVIRGPYFHTTINPKIGIKFWKVWLKGGPSVHLYKDYPKDQEALDFTKIIKVGNTLCNFEILIKF